jgi:hypothetical protein
MSENRGKGEVWRKKKVGKHLLWSGIGLRGGRE